MKSNLAVRTSAPAPYSVRRPTSLRSVLNRARTKIREDLLRFRTCCTDPRASK